MTTLRLRLGSIFQVEQRKFLLVLIFLCVSVLLGLAMTFEGGLLVLGALIGFGVLLLILIWPESATLVFMLLFYTNALVVASTFYGVPRTVAASFSMVLLVPLASHVILRRQHL